MLSQLFSHLKVVDHLAACVTAAPALQRRLTTDVCFVPRVLPSNLHQNEYRLSRLEIALYRRRRRRRRRAHCQRR